jgi:hypothetical protein
VPREGLSAAACRLEAIDATLADASPGDVGGAPMQARLRARVASVRRILDAAAQSDVPSRARLLRGARALRSFATTVARYGRRGKLRPDLAAGVVDDANRAVSALLAGARR